MWLIDFFATMFLTFLSLGMLGSLIFIKEKPSLFSHEKYRSGKNYQPKKK